MKNVSILVITFLAFSCQEVAPPNKQIGSLGVLHHPFTISDAAKIPFEKGLLQLHSFEYDDAYDSFQEAIDADPDELMSYWGSTMTQYKALWGLQDLETGREIMAQVGSTPEIRLARAENELEKDFWQGLEILFGDGELKERNELFAGHMTSLYNKYPGNEEVAAFYAISLLWAGGPGFDQEKSLLSSRVADGILKENPNHPGALHYKIHALDHPELAGEARHAADLYARVAPDATHALHMPSHIYLALGLWDHVVSSNEASYAASVARLERKNLGDESRGYHSYAWLHYGYLQQGRYRDAVQLLKDMYVYTEKAPTQSARSYLIAMQNAHLAEAPLWPEMVDPEIEIKSEDLGIVSEASHSFFIAHWAYRKSDLATIEAEIAQLKTKIATASLLVGEDGLAMCSAGTTRYAPNQNSLRTANVLLLQMEAFVARLRNDLSTFEEKLQAAGDLEMEIDNFGPPDIALPSFEQYGYWLLENDRPAEALSQFNMGLKRAPKRVNALRGKLIALKELAQKEEINLLNEELQKIWSKADDEALNTIATI